MLFELVNEYYGKTIAGKNTLQLIGKSKFISTMYRKCELLNVPTEFVRYPTKGHPAIVDHEVSDIQIPASQDIDGAGEFSAAAEAVYRLIDDVCETISGKSICIIGRGKAVRGLREALEARGATVVQCNSKTRNVLSLSAVCDIVILAAPINVRNVAIVNKRLIVDLAGKLSCPAANCGTVNFYSAGEIGRLTTAILAYRASIWEG